MPINPLVMKDVRIYLAGADLTGWSNKVASSASAEELDRTTFGSGGAKERWGGVLDMAATIDGFWEAGDLSKPDDTFWANLGTNTVPLTLVPTAGTVGSLAYLSRVFEHAYKRSGDHGKLLGFTLDTKGNWPMVRGTVMHPQGTARTATAAGTGQQLGALTANQAMYATLHITSVADVAANIVVTLESCVDNFVAAPTTRATFTAASALGGQAAKVVGPVTDTWWRVKWTVTGGVTPSFLFAAAAGIGPK